MWTFFELEVLKKAGDRGRPAARFKFRGVTGTMMVTGHSTSSRLIVTLYLVIQFLEVTFAFEKATTSVSSEGPGSSIVRLGPIGFTKYFRCEIMTGLVLVPVGVSTSASRQSG